MKVDSQIHYLWPAVDHEGEVLEAYVTKTRDKDAALMFLQKMKKRHGRPKTIVTDRLRSYGAALKAIGNPPLMPACSPIMNVLQARPLAILTPEKPQ